jgi:membrane-bound lytic murein transglycosylase MltF
MQDRTSEDAAMSILSPRTVTGALLLFVGLATLTQPARASSQLPTPPKIRARPTETKEWKGDFNGMLKRRLLRVLVPYSRSLYFNDKGHERGLTADLVREFERYVNTKYKKQLGNRPLTVYIVPTTRDELITDIAEGFGDIAAGNLTVTEERKTLVDFVAPADQGSISELVLTGPKSPTVATADELAGKTVHVRKASSYYESLTALNERLGKEGKPAVKLVLVPDALEDEDMMEMLNAGLLEAIVVDDWKAKMWAQVLPKIKVNASAVVRSGGLRGWAIRKGSPELEAELRDYWVKVLKKQNLHVTRMAQYFKRVRQIKDPTGTAEWMRFEETLALFQKYGQRYAFDPLMLAAQGYQESQLDQNAKSHVGAIGVMQLMPATGADLKVGDIRITEPNIHAGTKYMDQLMTKYFPKAGFSEANRSLFAFASYNAGPGRISQMRTLAVKRGLDPDKWFNNVEIVTAEKVGIETTTYVRNIYKYYTAYKLMLDVQEAQKKARDSVKQGG